MRWCGKKQRRFVVEIGLFERKSAHEKISPNLRNFCCEQERNQHFTGIKCEFLGRFGRGQQKKVEKDQRPRLVEGEMPDSSGERMGEGRKTAI